MTKGNGRFTRLLAGGVAGAAAVALVPTAAGAVVDTTAFCAGIPAGQSGFTDLAQAGTHARNVECAKGAGLTSGTSATTYSPTGNVSRAQMASFIANMIDRANALDAPGGASIPDLPASPPDAFTDDENTGAHEANINRLAAAGIVSGTSATTYSPTANVSRAQMATFIAQALAFVRGGPLPEGADRFTDDENTGGHEANINRLANADIVGGTSATTYNPTGLISRAQMASFLVQAMADLHADGFITPAPATGSAGVVTAVDGGANTYTFTNASNESVTVTYDATGDTFFVDGAAASLEAFEAALGVGDTVEFVDDPAAGDADADIHRLTNVNPAERRTGMIGNVDTGAGTFEIIDPATGVTIGGPHTYTGDVLQVAGAAAGNESFAGALNEGDTITGTVTGGTETWNLTNASVTGAAAAVDKTGAGVRFRIGVLGDVPTTNVNDLFAAGDGGTETFTIGGSAATAAEFETALDNGDTIVYSRTGGTETFALTNVAPAAQSGTASNDLDTTDDTITLTSGTTDIPVDYTGVAAYQVDALTVTQDQFETALTPGDQVTFTPDDPATAGTNEGRITLTNANLTGALTGIDTVADNYDVVNPEGNVVATDVAYVGAGHLYSRNGTPITVEQFETLLTKIAADATPDDTITVVFGAGSTAHQLTTDETL